VSEQKRAGPASKALTSADDIEELKKNEPVIVVFGGTVLALLSYNQITLLLLLLLLLKLKNMSCHHGRHGA
jgi:hypothetical protein